MFVSAPKDFKPAFPEDLFTPSMASFEALNNVHKIGSTPEKLREK